MCCLHCMACTSWPWSCHKVWIEECLLVLVGPWAACCKPGAFCATGFELQLSGTRHMSFLAQQGKASATHHSFFHVMAKLEGGWKKNADYNSCMCFGRENTVQLWARILPLSGKSLKTVILQTLGTGKACFSGLHWELGGMGTCWWRGREASWCCVDLGSAPDTCTVSVAVWPRLCTWSASAFIALPIT